MEEAQVRESVAQMPRKKLSESEQAVLSEVQERARDTGERAEAAANRAAAAGATSTSCCPARAGTSTCAGYSCGRRRTTPTWRPSRA